MNTRKLALLGGLAAILLGAVVTVVLKVGGGDSGKTSTPFPPPNWDQVWIGMSREEVLALLGKPTSRGPVGSFDTSGAPALSDRERIFLRFFLLFACGTGGLEALYSTGEVKGDWWEYASPTEGVRPFFKLGSSKEAFVVYFCKGKVIWYRRPTVGPYAMRDENAKN